MLLEGRSSIISTYFLVFGHPEVYIMILPAFGIVSHIIETFSRKQLLLFFYGMGDVVHCNSIICGLGPSYVHSRYAVGCRDFLHVGNYANAVPTGVKVFNWVATMFRGSITFETPMLFAVSFVVLFTIGGLSGLMLAIVPADFQYHDTYFVVAHFHYVLVPGAIFSIMAAVYYWIPKWCGNMYDERLESCIFGYRLLV